MKAAILTALNSKLDIRDDVSLPELGPEDVHALRLLRDIARDVPRRTACIQREMLLTRP